MIGEDPWMNSFIAWFDSKENKNSVEGNNLESGSQRRVRLSHCPHGPHFCLQGLRCFVLISGLESEPPDD
ncbi:Uncharacterised protein [Klebsiella pneumoniae]|nr:Uncharacterised protein [Klebsiella pneumoniae]